MEKYDISEEEYEKYKKIFEEDFLINLYHNKNNLQKMN